MWADEGQSVTLVITDVEGSTELWEWDQDSMMQVHCLSAQDGCQAYLCSSLHPRFIPTAIS